jgi:hypothetical protein
MCNVITRSEFAVRSPTIRDAAVLQGWVFQGPPPGVVLVRA